MTIMDALSVNLGQRAYSISIGSNLRADVAAAIFSQLKSGRKIAVLTDETVASRQIAALQSMFGHLPKLILPAGEETKSVAELGRVLEFLASQSLDRMGVLWVVGGGVMGDLGGFAAAS